MIFFELLFATSLLCLGTFHAIHQLYFTFYGKQLKYKGTISHKILKPFIFCVSCFASIWGCTFFYIYVSMWCIPFNWQWMVLNSICLVFLNGFFNDIYEKI